MATLTLTPDATTQLYRGQIFTLTATLTGSPNPIDPSTDYVTFTLTGLAELYTSWETKVPLTPDPQTPTNGTATLDVYVTAGATSPPTVTATSNILIATTPTNTYPPAKEIQVTAISGPDKTYIPSAPNDNGKPFDDNSKYTATMSVKIVEKGGTHPVPNIYVHWLHEYGFELYQRATPFGIDLSQTHPVDPKKTVELDPMADPFHPNRGWKMVRTPTDANGVATLYLVSKTTNNAFTRFFGKVLVMTNYYEIDKVGEVFSADLTIPQFGEQPVPKGLEDGVLMLDQSPGPKVPVHVPSYPGYSTNDTIFLLLNGELYNIFNWNSDEYSSSIPKSAIYSDTGPHAGLDNTLVFAAGGLQAGAGGIRVSGTRTFKAKGPKGPNAPDPDHYPGVLERLNIDNTKGVIDYQLIQSDLRVNIPLKQSNWTPAAGDKITLTFFINAYVPDTAVPKRAVLPHPPATHTLVAVDLGAGKDKYTFVVDGALFAGFDRESGPPYTNGNYKAVYKVEPVGGGALYSKIVDDIIDTTPPGKYMPLAVE